MKLYFIRHGQTDYNIEERIQGRLERELNAQGKIQAAEAIKTLPKNIHRIISSPKVRAKQTAEIINATIQAPLEIWEAFNEVDFGVLAGKTWEEVMELTQDLTMKDEFRKTNYNLRAFQGESKEEVEARIREAIEKIKTQYPNENILVVTHAPIVRMACKIIERKQESIIENAKLYEFEV